MLSRKNLLSFIALLFITQISVANDSFSVEDYGLLPDIRSMTISPDGEHYAFIKRSDEGDLFIIINIAQNKVVGGANASKVKARSVYFASNKHVILHTSKTRRHRRIRGKWEQSGAIVYNLVNKKMHVLTKDIEDLYIAQGGLGRIVGLDYAKNIAYVPAYIGTSEPSNSLMKVNLDTGKARRHARGNGHVIDWFVNAEGKVLAREEYREREQEHRVVSKVSGKWEVIYSKKQIFPRLGL